MRTLYSLLLLLPLAASSYGAACSNNTTTDPSTVQSAINAGGAVTITGTCAMGTTQVNVNTAVTVTGGATFVSTSGNFIFLVNVDNVTFNGMTFDGAAIHVTGAHETKRVFNLLNSTLRNLIGNGTPSAALDVDPILYQSTITGNTFQNLWYGGFANTTNCNANGTTTLCNSGAQTMLVHGILMFGGLDTTKIESNTFNQISGNAIKLFTDGLCGNTSNYAAPNVSISYNTFTYVHRIAVELQDEDSASNCAGGFNWTAAKFATPKLAGNLWMHPAYPWTEMYAYSLPLVVSNPQYINNAAIFDLSSVATTNSQRIGYAFETSPGTGNSFGGLGGGFYQGNVIAGDANAGVTPPSWFEAFVTYGNPTNVQYFQNQVMCGAANNTDTGMFTNANDIARYNYVNTTCPGGTGAGLTASNIQPVWTSTNNQTVAANGTATFNVSVPANTLPIRYVQFFVDGSSTPSVTQEIQDVNTNFAADRLWKYHAGLSASSLTSGAHSVTAKATDILGNTSTLAAQSFSVSSPAPAAVFSTSGSPVATPGQTITITSATPGTWALAARSSGTLTTIDSTHASYTAPAHIAAAVVTGGCQIGPNDTWYHTRVDSLPLNPNSAMWTDITTLHNINGQNLTSASPIPFRFQNDWPLNFMTNSDPTEIMTFAYTASQNGTVYQFPSIGQQREHGWFAHDSFPIRFTDHHTISLNTDICHMYELYQDNMSSYGDIASRCPNSQCNATSGWHWNTLGYDVAADGTTDAAGHPIGAVTLNLHEVLEAIRTGSMVVKHPLRFTTQAGFIYYGTFLWPSDFGGGGENNFAQPYSARWRLKSNIDATGIQSAYYVNQSIGYNNYFGTLTLTVSGCTTAPRLTPHMDGSNFDGITVTSPGSGCVNPTVTTNSNPGICNPCVQSVQAVVYNPTAQVILNTMKQYGIIIADIGDNNAITISQDLSSDLSAWTGVQQVGGMGLLATQFEVVDEAPLMVQDKLTRVQPAYATGQFADVLFTPSGGSAVTVPVVLQAITVGTPWSGRVSIQAGEPAYQIPYWIHGDTNNHGATWSISNCSLGTGLCGTITSGGLYTPPASVTAGTTTTVTLVATPVDDTQQSYGVYLRIYPSGVLRVDSGRTTGPYTDTQGHVWVPEQWDQVVPTMANGGNPVDDTYGSENFYPQSLPDVVIYETAMLGEGNSGGDIVSNPLIEPNGVYTLHLMFAMTGEGGGWANCWGSNRAIDANGNPVGHMVGPMNLLVNGKVVSYNYDQNLATNSMCRTPNSVDLPAVVTNNRLQWGIYTDPKDSWAPTLSGYTITPYTGPIKWVIDSEGINNLKPGATAQLHVQDWGTGKDCSNSTCTWSVSGPGTVSSSGLYTAPSTAPSLVTDAVVTVTNGTQTATLPLRLISAAFPRLVAK